ncbi:MAG: M48 family metallopeptidase [Symploca sp. SIO2G7]|nr:M48 family metallopeptidase [Symploca sp. SIO2G7]
MNFFDNQARARRQSKWLIVLFMLAVASTLLAINLIMLATLGRFESADQGWFSPSFWWHNGQIVFWTSLITGGVIGIGSVYRSMQLNGGGEQVARELGGTQVDGTTTDRMHRRLLNVVEEMAIASGVPVPAVFVLEHEQGINAFAAGWSPSDAAVAVTRGALDSLSREELQGVIAHEFSHVFNGDMRLNIRLMGVLFGIMMLAVIGRKVLRGFRHGGSNNKNAGAIVVFGVAILAVGYIGLFFGRWIQSGVSRQREYLADASAVQFTRNPGGIGGALKKIGALSTGSRLVVNTEEVSHMLFAQGFSAALFATHPPLVKRIVAVDPNFNPSQLVAIGEQLLEDRRVRRLAREQRKPSGPSTRPDEDLREDAGGKIASGGLPLDPATLIEQIGQPSATQIALVAALLAALPQGLKQSAHSDDWAVDAVLYLLLSTDVELRERQLLMIAETRGSESEQQVRQLHQLHGKLAERQRLPLVELAFPTLRRQPQAELVKLMGLIERLIESDGELDVFEYVLARLLNREIEDALRPTAARATGNERLSAHPEAAVALLAVVAVQGQHVQPDQAQAAFRHALGTLGERFGQYADQTVESLFKQASDAWPKKLDRAFTALHTLKLEDKQRLIEALLASVRFDGKIIAVEYELLRLVAGVLRVPLPVIA